MRALMLGGSGFIGRWVCTGLAAAGAEVTVVRQSPGRPLPGVHEQVVADLAADPGAAAELVRRVRPGLVVNAAGAVWTGDDAALTRANVRLVHALLAAVADPDRPVRLVHLGSALEYAPAVPGQAIDETAPVGPSGRYGVTKLLGTQAVLAAAEAGHVDAVVLRLFNVLGPGLPPSSLAGSAAARLAAHEPGGVLEFDQLAAERDYVDVRDVAAAVVAAATAERPGRVVNIGSGRATGARALVDRLIAVSGRRATLRVRGVEPAVASARRTTGTWQCADIRRAADRLGWHPRISLDRSLADLWATVA